MVRMLVNQLLKDKGPTSYDWRIPLHELEKHYKRQGDSDLRPKEMIRNVFVKKSKVSVLWTIQLILLQRGLEKNSANLCPYEF